MNPEAQSCPSAKCRQGAKLLGIVQGDGTIAYLGSTVIIDEHFVRIASAGRDPEKRFRFSDQCVEAGCKQWTGTRCSVVEDVIRHLSPKPRPLPECSIRPRCRWFNQAGQLACFACPFVVTNLERSE